MNFNAHKTTLAAAVALTASVGLTLPAAAQTYEHGAHSVRAMRHHAMIRHDAYRAGYNRGFRDGHYAAMASVEPGLETGRSAYVAPGQVEQPGVFGNGGLLGLGILGGNGVLGTGVLNGQGALGVGVLGL